MLIEGIKGHDKDIIRKSRDYLAEIKNKAQEKFPEDIRNNIKSLYIKDMVFLANTKSFFINLFFKITQRKSITFIMRLAFALINR